MELTIERLTVIALDGGEASQRNVERMARELIEARRELSALSTKPEREVVGWRVRVYGHDPDIAPYEPWQHAEPSRDYAEKARSAYRIAPDAWRKAVLVKVTRRKAEVGR
jgi:hypothetical protein